MSIATAAIANDASKWRLNAWRVCLSLSMTAGAVLIAVPEIDLWLSGATYSPATGFIGWRLGWVGWLRTGFIVFYFSCVGIALICWVASARGLARVFDAKQWLFILVCLGVGPGLLANVAFKDQWGRARPKQIIAFGGTKLFTPALQLTNQCPRNCSFVSGEAASMFVPFYAAAAVAPQWAATLLVLGTLAGFSAGFVRVIQGAHFLSDVVFAGLFMGLMVMALQRLMLTSAGWSRLHAGSRWPRPSPRLKRAWH